MPISETTNLPYPKLENVILSETDNITDANLNVLFGRLLQNDQYLSPLNGNFPLIWECKWFNNSTLSGYNSGDSFWYNTETTSSFLNTYASKIYDYASNHPYLKNIIVPWNRYDVECIELYEKIAFGYTDGNVSLPKLFDIGDITKPAQIRISKFDNNKQPLSDDNAYDNFFIDNLGEMATANVDELISEIMDDHVKKYHLGDSLQTISASVGNYLKRDMSNLSGVQSPYLGKTVSIQDSSGFDYPKKFVRSKQNNGCCAWYRLWGSGLLEHGGIVRVTKSSRHVNFAWTYSLNKTAPIYQYGDNVNDFYGSYTKFDDNSDISTTGLRKRNRYTVSLSPILSKASSEFPSIEIMNIKNDGFDIKYDSDIQMYYSYYVRGFVSNG